MNTSGSFKCKFCGFALELNHLMPFRKNREGQIVAYLPHVSGPWREMYLFQRICRESYCYKCRRVVKVPIVELVKPVPYTELIKSRLNSREEGIPEDNICPECGNCLPSKHDAPITCPGCGRENLDSVFNFHINRMC